MGFALDYLKPSIMPTSPEAQGNNDTTKGMEQFLAYKLAEFLLKTVHSDDDSLIDVISNQFNGDIEQSVNLINYNEGSVQRVKDALLIKLSSFMLYNGKRLTTISNNRHEKLAKILPALNDFVEIAMLRGFHPTTERLHKKYYNLASADTSRLACLVVCGLSLKNPANDEELDISPLKSNHLLLGFKGAFAKANKRIYERQYSEAFKEETGLGAAIDATVRRELIDIIRTDRAMTKALIKALCDYDIQEFVFDDFSLHKQRIDSLSSISELKAYYYQCASGYPCLNSAAGAMHGTESAVDILTHIMSDIMLSRHAFERLDELCGEHLKQPWSESDADVASDVLSIFERDTSLIFGGNHPTRPAYCALMGLPLKNIAKLFTSSALMMRDKESRDALLKDAALSCPLSMLESMFKTYELSLDDCYSMLTSYEAKASLKAKGDTGSFCYQLGRLGAALQPLAEQDLKSHPIYDTFKDIASSTQNGRGKVSYFVMGYDDGLINNFHEEIELACTDATELNSNAQASLTDTSLFSSSRL